MKAEIRLIPWAKPLLSLLRFAVEPNIKKDPLEMRLNQRRRGDCYYNNNIGATRSQGIWAFSLITLCLLISLCQHQRRRGAPGNHPGHAPFRSNAHKRLIFVITSYSGSYSTGCLLRQHLTLRRNHARIETSHSRVEETHEVTSLRNSFCILRNTSEIDL